MEKPVNRLLSSCLWVNPRILSGSSKVLRGTRGSGHLSALCLAVLALGLLCSAANAQTSEWAWMDGSSGPPADKTGLPGVYGTLATPAASNVPGSRVNAVSWTDKSGNLWLFGGLGFDSAGTSNLLNDLWEFNTSTQQWAWMGGSSTIPESCTSSQLICGQPGVYGTLGTPAAGNAPGGRTGASSWIDSGGNLWLFGGSGMDSTGTTGTLNDLWEFNTSTQQWAWMSGSNVVPSKSGDAGQPGVYGTLGVPAAANAPGGRSRAVSWTDKSGNLWLFGGLGFDSAGNSGRLNDLWVFNPSTKEWAWENGSSASVIMDQLGDYGQPGVYGTIDVPTAGNVPGARYLASGWTDGTGNLWLFGGVGYDSAGNCCALNDLWKFDPPTNEWTWMSGSSILSDCTTFPGGVSACGEAGVYGALGIPAAGNVPGGRDGAANWIDNRGNLWLFGGVGYDSAGNSGRDLNDLWEFSPATREWVWMGGSSSVATYASVAGVYGTLGVPAAGNLPGGRDSAAYWTDRSGNFWLFGGNGSDSMGDLVELNDLWVFQSTVGTLPAATPSLSVPTGAYTSAQTVTISDATPGATIYYTTNGTSPTTSSTQYTGPITVSTSETLEASAIASGYSQSSTASAVLTITIPGFRVSGTPVTVTPGATTGNTSTITVAPNGGFAGSVVLTAVITSSPADAQYPPTLSFGSTSPISITGTNGVTATLTISATAASGPQCTSAIQVHPIVPWYITGGAALACVFLFGIPARRRKWHTMLGLMVLLVALANSVLACSGDGSTPCKNIVNSGTTAGAYTVTVTGTSGTTTAADVVTLTVE